MVSQAKIPETVWLPPEFKNVTTSTSEARSLTHCIWFGSSVLKERCENNNLWLKCRRCNYILMNNIHLPRKLPDMASEHRLSCRTLYSDHVHQRTITAPRTLYIIKLSFSHFCLFSCSPPNPQTANFMHYSSTIVRTETMFTALSLLDPPVQTRNIY